MEKTHISACYVCCHIPDALPVGTVSHCPAYAAMNCGNLCTLIFGWLSCQHVCTHLSFGLMVQVAVLNNRGMNKKGYGRPTILALSRQGVPNLPGTSKEGVEKGGYIVHGGDEKPDAIILATGKPPMLSPMLLTDRGSTSAKPTYFCSHSAAQPAAAVLHVSSVSALHMAPLNQAGTVCCAAHAHCNV